LQALGASLKARFSQAIRSRPFIAPFLFKIQIPENTSTRIAENKDHGHVQTKPQHFETVIIGTGFSGLLAAMRLKKERLDDFVLLERSSNLGGTWRDNSYPGAEVDVPTGLYSISFVPYPFSKRYAPQSELLKYTNHIIDKFDLRERTKTNQAVTRLTVFMGRAQWIIPRSDRNYGAVERFVTNLPGIRHIKRFMIFGYHEVRFIAFRRYPFTSAISRAIKNLYARNLKKNLQRYRAHNADWDPHKRRQRHPPGHHCVRDGILCLHQHGQGAHVPGLWPGRPQPEQRMGTRDCLLQRHRGGAKSPLTS
jgi:hypothetical protein